MTNGKGSYDKEGGVLNGTKDGKVPWVTDNAGRRNSSTMGQNVQ